MILCTSGVLNADELADIQQALTKIEFRDGRVSAGWHAREVKRNLQAPSDDPAARLVAATVERAVRRHPLFEMAARPRTLAPLLLSRYEPGMTYGAHVDDAVMGKGNRLRTDLALTVFLNAPTDYEGGALVVESTGGEQEFKLDAGDMVLYPASSLHRVEPIRRGVRHAAVGWVQSMVRDPLKREILFDLETARRGLFEHAGKTREFDLMAKSISNLLRLWAEP